MVTLFIMLFVLQTVASSSSSSRPLVIGHRGTAYLPESTLAAQSMAHAYGADIIEIDVCLSRDDQLIVIHGEYRLGSPVKSSLHLPFRYLSRWIDECA